MKKVIFWSGIIVILAIFTTVAVKNIQLKQNCTGHLERAANANTVDIAKEELNTAISYLEQKEFTSGYTSVLWKTPNEDVGFFYNNLIQARVELNKIDTTTTALEKTNVLMKLRETLTDNEKIICPPGLSRYPHNALWGVALWLASILTVLSLIIAGVLLEE